MQKISVLLITLSFLCSGAMAQQIQIILKPDPYAECRYINQEASVAYEGPSGSMSKKKEAVVYDSPAQQKTEPGLGYDPGVGFAYEQSEEEKLYLKARKELQIVESFIDIMFSYANNQEVEGVELSQEQINTVTEVLFKIYDSYTDAIKQ